MVYLVVSAQTVSDLILEVASQIAAGYTPLGGVSVSAEGCYQAMTKAS